MVGRITNEWTDLEFWVRVRARDSAASVRSCGRCISEQGFSNVACVRLRPRMHPRP